MDPQPRSLSLAIELVALSVWLGATALFAAVVAPALFDALPSRTMAGDVVGRVLPALLLSGVVISLVVGLLEAMAQNAIFTAHWTPGSRAPDSNDVVHFGGARLAGQRAGAGFLIGVVCLWALQIGQKIDKLRASVGQPIDALPVSDPRRVEFGRLHALSVAVLGVAMLFAAGLAFSAARRLVGRDAARRTFQPSLEPSHHA
jgi:hypothetical protein